MIFNKTSIEGVYIIDTEPHNDKRGFFARVFCVKELLDTGIDVNAVQINVAHNNKIRTLRGLHLQTAPYEEIKIIRCVRGAIYDVAVDVRPLSPTFGQYVSAELTQDNGRMLVVPQGFAHGYMTLCDNTDVMYFVSESYASENEKGYRFDDPVFGIKWPYNENLEISEKDLSWEYVTAYNMQSPQFNLCSGNYFD